MSDPDIGITEADRRKMGEWARDGVRADAKNGGGNGQPAPPDGIELTCQRCGHEWRYTGTNTFGTCSQCGLKRRLPAPDGRGLTKPQCNAIREAARDGLPYREIADLFSFIKTATAANRHATGRCSHDGPGIEPKRTPGPVNAVDAEECATLRDAYADTMTVPDLADATGRAQSTVYRHVIGDCSHE